MDFMMRKKTVLISMIAILGTVLLAAALQGYFMTGVKREIPEKSREDVLNSMTGGQQGTAAASRLIKYREIDEKTGKIAWEVECKKLVQLEGDKQFNFSDGVMTFFNYNRDGTFTTTKVKVPSARIVDKVGYLEGGVTLQGQEGISLLLDDATVDMDHKTIRSDSRARLYKKDPKSGKTLLKIIGKGLRSDTRLQFIQMQQVEEIRMVDAAGSAGGDIVGDCSGKLEIDTVSGLVRFKDKVHLQSSTSRLSADSLLLKMDPETRKPRELEAKGNVDFTYKNTTQNQAQDQSWQGKCEFLRWLMAADLRALHPSLANAQSAGVEPCMEPSMESCIILSNPASGAPVLLHRGQDTLKADKIYLLDERGEFFAIGHSALKMKNAQPGGSLLQAKEITAAADILKVLYTRGNPVQLKSLSLKGNCEVIGGEDYMAGDSLTWDQSTLQGKLLGSPAIVRNEQFNLEASSVLLDRAKKYILIRRVASLDISLPQNSDSSLLPGQWKITADEVKADFNDDYSDLTFVHARGAVTAVGKPYTIQSDTADFDVSAQTLKLRGKPARVDVSDTGEWVKAPEITLDQNKHTIHARDNVRMLLKRALVVPGKNAGGKSASDPFHVESDEASVQFDNDNKLLHKLVLTGRVVVSGEDFGGKCAKMTATQNGERFVLEARPGEKIQIRYGENHFAATHIEKSKFLRASGGVEVISTAKLKKFPDNNEAAEPWKARADEMDLYLDEKNNTLIQWIARGGVTFHRGELAGSADKLIWLDAPQFGLFTGSPARISYGADKLSAPKLYVSFHDNTMKGEGGVELLMHTPESKAKFGDLSSGEKWKLTGRKFKASFGPAPNKPEQTSILAAQVDGKVLLVSGEFKTRGSRFNWDGKTRTGKLTGDPFVLVKRGDGWMKARAISFSPQKRPGQKNFIDFIGAVEGVLPANHENKENAD